MINVAGEKLRFHQDVGVLGQGAAAHQRAAKQQVVGTPPSCAGGLARCDCTLVIQLTRTRLAILGVDNSIGRQQVRGHDALALSRQRRRRDLGRPQTRG